MVSNTMTHAWGRDERFLLATVMTDVVTKSTSDHVPRVTERMILEHTSPPASRKAEQYIFDIHHYECTHKSNGTLAITS
jgi:hypothetical protein